MSSMQNTRVVPLAFTLVVVTAAGWAEEHTHRQMGKHVHGAGELNVALERGSLRIELDSPAANLVGFEHPPRNQKEQQAVASALQRLRDSAALFSLPAAADCEWVEANVATDIAGNDAEEEKAESGKHAHEEDVHSDFHASYAFTCAKPEALTHIDVKLFQVFPRTQELEVQLITEQGQKRVELTAASPRLQF